MKRRGWVGPRALLHAASKLAVIAVAAVVALAACNAERQQECGKLQAALKPLGDAPTSEAVKRAQAAANAIAFQDEPLHEYAKSAVATMKVLASTMDLQGDPSAPDGTNDVVKTKLKELAGEEAEVARYCSP